MAKKEVNASTPQQELDLMFWQYVQGVKDAVEHGTNTTKVEIINKFIQKKLRHIQETHKKNPSFTLKAEMIMGKIEIKKKLV